MNDKIKTTNPNLNYVSLKSKEEELIAQLKVLRKEIENVENDIVTEKLNTALQCLADVDKMTGGYYRCTIETYCEDCEENGEVDVDLADIIQALQQIK